MLLMERGQDVQKHSTLCQTARLPSSSCNEVNKRLPKNTEWVLELTRRHHFNVLKKPFVHFITRVILQFDVKLKGFGHLDLSPSISSRTLKILENRLLRSLQHVHKNSVMKEIRKIFPQLKRYLVLKLVYKFLLPCFINMY